MTDVNTPVSENEQIAERRKKLSAWREQTQAYPNDFRPDISAQVCHSRYGAMSKEELEEKKIMVNVAGRIVLRRVMGKASFATLQDDMGRIQIYLTRDGLPEGFYNATKHWDLGDIIGVSGSLFLTKTGELTVRVESAILLTKALRPLPDKFHGLSDGETRARQRYLDLISNDETRQRFRIRSRLISALREHLEQHDFMEVETPMLHPLIGGAAAKPFNTHHNALDMPLYMRIAPELYLKRLIVGGFNRVYELNRNFRNEGLSTRHNPEFTMVEFYQAYADYKMLMDFTEVMLRDLAEKVLGRTTIHFNATEIDLTTPFARMTINEAILHYDTSIDPAQLESRDSAAALAKKHGIEVADIWGLGKIQTELFEEIAESKLLQPTFITAFPAEVSPLARPSNADPFYTDRFELYVGGQEIANGFSELNDPEDQAERFKAQLAAKDAGEEETMSFDQDYITALEHGLPPTAGEGIGIDRLAMLFTDSASIRDVILFPQLRNKD